MSESFEEIVSGFTHGARSEADTIQALISENCALRAENEALKAERDDLKLGHRLTQPLPRADR